jgi:phosphoserine phosphatase RsbU/P
MATSSKSCRFTPGCVDIIVGDVMGKGPLAAILAADVKLQVQRQITNHVINTTKERFSTSDIVNSIHKTITPKLIELESFVTLQYCRIDRINKLVTVVCCGHPPPYILSSRGVKAFGGQNLPLGILLDELYEEYQCEIDAGCSVISYSDGLSEAKNKQGDAYGESGLSNELALYQERGVGANALVESVHASVLEFIDARALGDDLTLVVAHVPDEALNLQRLQLPREIDRITDLRRFIERLAVSQSWPHDVLDKITLVVVEVFTNIVRHSSAMIGNSALEVQMHDDPKSVWVTIESLGQYFDPVHAESAPHSPLDLTREGGFGLQIINSLTDVFQYERIGRVNRIKMGFHLEHSPA